MSEGRTALTGREARACQKAEGLLAYGDNSAAALLQKLRRAGYTEAESTRAVSEMLQKGYLKEREQAYRFAVLSVRSRYYGPRRILAALVQKGYPAALSRAAIAEAVADGEIDFSAAAAALLEKKYGRPEDVPAQLRKKTLYQYGY